MTEIPMHVPVIEDHVLFCFHDVACPVCQNRKAVRSCDKCSARGWKLIQHKPSRWKFWR